MERREMRGLMIACTKPPIERDGRWLVWSESGAGYYEVVVAPGAPACSCPDFRARRLPCKHINAVCFWILLQALSSNRAVQQILAFLDRVWSMPTEGYAAGQAALERIERRQEELLNEVRQLAVEGSQGASADAEYVSLHEAARITGLSYSHLYRAVRSGRLSASNVG